MGWTRWQAAMPGPLGRDGAFLLAGRGVATGRCAVCGRRAHLWQVTVELPGPFPPVRLLHGCTRDHATARMPTSWSDVAAALESAGQLARSGDDVTVWHERFARYRTGQGEMAAFLASQSPAARRLALQLLANDSGLSVGTVEAVIAAVLAEPAT